MLMPKAGATKPYIRLDYTLAGKRTQRTAGKADNWENAWALASEIDEQIAAEIALESGDPKALTVAMLAQAWTEAKEGTWTPRYREDNADRLRAIVLPALGSTRVADLTREDTRALVMAQPSRSGRRHLWGLLSAMLQFGVLEGTVDRNVRQILPPLKDFQAAKATIAVDASDPDSARTVEALEMLDDDHDERRLRYIKPDSAPSTDDVLRLIEHLQKPRCYTNKHARKEYLAPDHYTLMFLVAAFCGLRQGELWALRGRDVEGAVLHVRRQLTWVKGEPKFTLPKCGKQRDVYVYGEVQGFALGEMLADRAAKVGPDGRLFPTSTGALFRRSNFARDVMAPLRDAAWPGRRWTFHSLRHHYCRWMLEQGADVTDVAKLAGHANVQVTLTMYVSHNEGLMSRMASLEADKRHRKGRDR
jgi:integrase